MKSLAKRVTKDQKITSEIVEKFARIVGDMNPIHLDQQVARQSRFGKRIAHGMIGVSYIQSMLPAHTTYSKLNIKFMKPIYIDQVINIQLLLYQEDKQLKLVIKKEDSNPLNKQENERKFVVVTEASGVWDQC